MEKSAKKTLEAQFERTIHEFLKSIIEIHKESEIRNDHVTHKLISTNLMNWLFSELDFLSEAVEEVGFESSKRLFGSFDFRLLVIAGLIVLKEKSTLVKKTMSLTLKILRHLGVSRAVKQLIITQHDPQKIIATTLFEFDEEQLQQLAVVLCEYNSRCTDTGTNL